MPASSARAQDPPAPAQAPAAPGQSPAAAPQDAAAPAAAPQQPDAPPAAPVPVTTLQVTVRNTTNNFVIDNAAVRLESETERSRSRATSRLGIALFQKIPDGTYNVIVQAVGFKTATLNGVVVAPGKTTNVIISMQVNAQTVVVRRARETLNVRDTSISVIRDQAFFQDIPFNAENRQDLNSFLLSVPGVAKDVMNRVVPRGEDNVSRSIYADGFLMPGIAQGNLVPFVQPTQMTRFRAITGGFAPEYGGGSGLILDAELKSPPPRRGMPDLAVGFGGGEFNTTNDYFELGNRFAKKKNIARAAAQKGISDKSIGYLVIGSQNYTDNIAEPAQASGQATRNYGASESFFGKFDYQLTPRAVMRGVINFSSGRSDVINRLGLSNDYAQFGQGFGFAGLRPESSGLLNQQQAGQLLYQKDNNSESFFQIDRTTRTGGHLLIGVGGGISDLSYYNRTFNAAGIGALPADNSVEYLPTVHQNYNQVQAQIDYTPASKNLHQMKYGFTYNDIQGKERYFYVPQSQTAAGALAEIDPRLGTQNLNGDVYTPLFFVNREGYFAGGYIQDTWKVRPNMTLNWGGRFDIYNAKTGSGDFNTSNGIQTNAGVLADVNKSQFSPRVNFAFMLPQGGNTKRGPLGKLMRILKSQPTIFRLAYNSLFTPPGMSQGSYLGDQVAENAGGTRTPSALVPQSTSQIDMSMERQLTPTRILKLGYYNKDIQHYLQTEQLVPGLAGGMTTIFNQGHVVVDGVEATLDLLPPNENGVGYHGFLTLASSSTRPKSGGEVNNYGNSLGAVNGGTMASFMELDQESTISFGFAYKTLKGASAGLSVYYGSGLYASALKPTFSPERASSRQSINEVNLRLSTGPTLLQKRAWIQLDVDNLTDSRARMTFQDAFAGTRFQQGRRALLSFNMKY